MTANEPARPPGNNEARYLLLITVCTVSWGCAVLLLDPLTSFRVPTTYVLPPVLGVALLIAIRLARMGTAPLPRSLASLGVLFIVGGAAFDMIATAIHTPGLEQEANPIARTLLDSGHPVQFVYGYAVIAQALWLGLTCTLCLALFTHRNMLISSIGDHPTFLAFLKAAAGCGHLTWRQWLIPIKWSELPRAYHLLWILTVLHIAGCTDRWYLGLTWFGLAPPIRWVVWIVSVAIGLAVYIGWLWRTLYDMKTAS